jgi:hypothetical protein
MGPPIPCCAFEPRNADLGAPSILGRSSALLRAVPLSSADAKPAGFSGDSLNLGRRIHIHGEKGKSIT